MDNQKHFCTDSYWIGLSDRVTEGTFIWINGVPASFTYWSPGQPDNYGQEDCVVIWGFDNMTWSDQPCDLLMGYICESKIQ